VSRRDAKKVVNFDIVNLRIFANCQNREKIWKIWVIFPFFNWASLKIVKLIKLSIELGKAKLIN
jgi:hypothetical protein